ncbi:hypothetical protein H4R20_004259 [Coemansia guatemalensis]|uniref:Uncharacterized protein n=1 Tax=Coemansia guatemalensis TaxID=2761395 RepID=A0A9W8HRT2_9FUNG|nr:hypothetical protein H4R20_004259 [Coemansia guatemalensis]
MEQTTPPPSAGVAPAAPNSATPLTAGESEGMELNGSRSESVQSSDTSSNGPQPVEVSDSMCLWDILRQMEEPNADAEDASKPGVISGFIGLNHVDRVSRHRNLHQERAIRILN